MAILLLRYSEIGLKGISVRNRWENRLKDNILQMLAADGVEALVTRGQARFYVEAADLDAAIRSIRKVFGVGSISIAETCSNDMETICSTVAEYSKSRMVKGKTFAVKARREGGQKYTSMDLAKSCGDAIWNANLDKDPKVNLKDPDIVFWVESRPRDAFIFQDYIYCHGLPMGTQGHVLAYVDNDRGVLSALLMMKRGCKVIVRGEYGLDLLREYDPNLKVVDDNYITAGRVLGFVKGYGLDDIEDYDPSGFDLPVFFPTVGMSDSEVEERMEVYRKEAAESPRRR